eukprot:TRINITY_DN35301_c0_g1_i1.p1 TRINITY_DN35301_c0_g1~~TRINITY_DN35301_c0_g1_i1.p1  ORF type:complete len:340 (+),score=66.29 TRINITY_DN35301_c0_g1_i1:48-1067(+)
MTKGSITFCDNPEWKDVKPVPQDDGPEPLAVISYPPGFEEVHDYFRAIQKLGEFSERALALTGDVIEHNSANYTAWWYRRRCLHELGCDLSAEHVFTDKWSKDCPKNYQVWYHRRWLISEIAKQIRAKAPNAESAEKEIADLARKELENHTDCMQVNDDYKNYNGWSHRQFILQAFGLWDEELPFVEDLLRDDIRNNSAWNHRYTVVRKQSWPFSDAVKRREIDYAVKSIRSCANNECAWNYLTAFLGAEEGKIPWSEAPALEALCEEVLSAAADQASSCRFANETLATMCEARGDVAGAQRQYSTLKEIDKIRFKYWEWKEAYLLQRTGKAAPVSGDQ